MDSDLEQQPDWYEQCHVCKRIDHFRELEYDPYTEQWTCIVCIPKFDPNDPACIEAARVESDVWKLEAMWLLEPGQA